MNLLFLSNIFFFFNVYTKFLLLLINRNCTIKLYNNILFQCSRIILRKYPHSSENIKIVTYKPITSKFMKRYIYIYFSDANSPFDQYSSQTTNICKISTFAFQGNQRYTCNNISFASMYHVEC